MKKIIFLAFIAFSVTTIFSSCKKETIVQTKTTGRLIVLPKLSGSTLLLPGTDIGIATSLDNLNNGIYLQDITSGSNGTADFGELNPGNYYIDASYFDGTNSYFSSGQFQITANTDLNLSIYLN
jgi:hypothetical protein